MSKLITLIIFLFGFNSFIHANEKKSERKTMKIHNSALTVDTHCDTPMAMLDEGFDIGIKNTPPQSRVDFPRMKEGGLDAIFFAAFTGQRETNN